MFKSKSKATLALVVDLHEELIRKIEEQIRVEKEFILKLESFFMFEQKMERERWRAEQLDDAGKKILDNDRRF